MSLKLNTKSFIEKANLKHEKFYDYSKVEYELSCKKVIIICPLHGEFEQEANSHLQGHGCKICRNEKLNLENSWQIVQSVVSSLNTN